MRNTQTLILSGLALAVAACGDQREGALDETNDAVAGPTAVSAGTWSGTIGDDPPAGGCYDSFGTPICPERANCRAQLQAFCLGYCNVPSQENMQITGRCVEATSPVPTSDGGNHAGWYPHCVLVSNQQEQCAHNVCDAAHADQCIERDEDTWVAPSAAGGSTGGGTGTGGGGGGGGSGTHYCYTTTATYCSTTQTGYWNGATFVYGEPETECTTVPYTYCV